MADLPGIKLQCPLLIWECSDTTVFRSANVLPISLVYINNSSTGAFCKTHTICPRQRGQSSYRDRFHGNFPRWRQTDRRYKLECHQLFNLICGTDILLILEPWDTFISFSRVKWMRFTTLLINFLLPCKTVTTLWSSYLSIVLQNQSCFIRKTIMLVFLTFSSRALKL